jgi:hypothetical protein
MRTLEPPPQWAHLPIYSASRLTLFTRCQLAYYITYVLEQRLPPHPTAHIGTAVHRALEYYYRSCTDLPGEVQHMPPISAVPGVFSTYIAHVPSEVDTSFILNGLEVLLTYRVPRISSSLQAIEYEFLVPFPSPTDPFVLLHGYLDYLYRDGVLDVKTARKKPSGLEHNLQFQVYHYAFTTLFGRPPAFLYWHHVQTGDLIHVPVASYTRLHAVSMAVQAADRDRTWVRSPCRFCTTPTLCQTYQDVVLSL